MSGAELAPPYLAPRYELGRDLIALRLGLTALEAAQLGPAFAAIDPWARYPYPASALTAYLAKAEPHAPRYAVLDGAVIIGALGLRLDWLRGPYVQFLAVLPANQTRGIGALILAWVERQALASAERNLWVAASDFNTGALRFYERHGFSRVADLDGLVREGRKEILLRKRIAD